MRAESAETERPLGVLTRGVTTTHGEIVSGVVNGQVTLTRLGGDGSGAGASKMMAAGGATDITMHDLNDTVNHAIPLRIEKLPRLMVEIESPGDMTLIFGKELARNGPKMDRPPRPKTNPSIHGWRQNVDRLRRTNLLPNVIHGKATAERPVLEIQYGKAGNTSTTPTRTAVRQGAPTWALEGAIAPPRG